MAKKKHHPGLDADSVDTETGLVAQGELNQIVIKKTYRPNGTLRIQQDFRYCPSLAEQHSARETDINYLMKRYQPDELAQYLAARAAYRQEIVGYDETNEPSLQEAKNIAFVLKESFNALPAKIRENFSSHVEFLKFIDNPANQEKLVELGILTRKQIRQHTDPKLNDDSNDETPGSPPAAENT